VEVRTRRSQRRPGRPAPGGARRRAGVASLDFVLAMGVILPMIAFVLWAAPRIMNLVYEMTSVLVSWPFL
ncbi:MAG: hypothetical protein ACODAD_11890, partial [Planctomycetota bacterium]